MSVAPRRGPAHRRNIPRRLIPCDLSESVDTFSGGFASASAKGGRRRCHGDHGKIRSRSERDPDSGNGMNSLLQLLGNHGLAVAFVNVLLVQLGLPVPAYPALIVTGALIAQAHESIAALLGAAVAGSLVADVVWYAAGRRYGGRVVRTVCRISLSPDSCVRQTESLFARWGPASLLIAKFVPGFGTIATTLSGSNRLPFATFVALDALGAALYAGAAIVLGVIFSDAVGSVLAVFEQMGRIGVVALLVALALFIGFRWWQRASLLRELRMTRISVAELADLVKSETAPTILDVRSAESRQRDGTIPGAIHWSGEAGTALGDDVMRDAEIVVFCACPNEVSAARVARALRLAGFEHVRPLHGGIDAWIDAGLPVARPEALAPA
jgi:membrane protein DedA with SNARE-associated domain/rhodanese-related sulfurtransferase